VLYLRFSKYTFCMKDDHHRHHNEIYMRQGVHINLVVTVLSPFVFTHPNSEVQSCRNLATSGNYEPVYCLIKNLTIRNTFYVSESNFLFNNNQGNKHCPFPSLPIFCYPYIPKYFTSCSEVSIILRN
jgi:hypothetical protein